MAAANRRERDLAAECTDHIAQSASVDTHDLIASLLAAYREELLRPFVELHKDALAYRDTRAAAVLGEVIATVRGEQ